MAGLTGGIHDCDRHRLGRCDHGDPAESLELVLHPAPDRLPHGPAFGPPTRAAQAGQSRAGTDVIAEVTVSRTTRIVEPRRRCGSRPDVI